MRVRRAALRGRRDLWPGIGTPWAAAPSRLIRIGFATGVFGHLGCRRSSVVAPTRPVLVRIPAARTRGASVVSRRLRVLMVNDYGRPTGGAELQMLALRDGLRDRGHSVRLFSSDAALTDGYPLLADAACRGRTDLAQVASQTANPSAWTALRRELAAHPPDVVHIRMFLFQLSPLILPLLRDVPVLFQAAVYKAICPNGMKLLPDGTSCTLRAGRVCRTSGCISTRTWMAAMAQLAMVRRWRDTIDLSTALSRRMADLFEADGWGSMRVLGNGVDERPMRPPLPDRPLVVYAGRLSREKGVGTLLDAFLRVAADLPQARLHIAGAGPMEAELRARAAPLGDRVAFLGHLSRPEMEAAFAPAWAQAVPSLWHEPFGNVSTEAMMRGTAVVASDMGGQSDIVRDEVTGYLVPAGDAEALAARLTTILSDRALAERLGHAGRTVALDTFSRGRALDRIEDAYAETRRRHAAAQGARVPA